MKVESKYKNPDLFIQRLKAEVDRAESRFFKRQIGDPVCRYRDDATDSLGAEDQYFGAFNPKDTVLIRARVVKVEQGLGGSLITFDTIEFRRVTDDIQAER